MHPTRRRLIVAAALAASGVHAQPTATGAGPAAGLPPELASLLPQARLRGEGRLRFFGLHVYDIRLWSPADALAVRWDRAPLALELVYARALKGRQIAARSVQEMRRQAPLDDSRAAAWEAELARLFPDVAAGDRLTGVHRPGAPTRLFHNGQPRGEWQDPDLSRLFFGIWLAPQTSEPDLRRQLLGGVAGS